MAVLDIDSADTNTFDDEDRRQLENWVAWFARNPVA
jgi:putative methionine-R-sulfoxide reductase with GAF domain